MNKITVAVMFVLANVMCIWAGQIEECKLKKSVGGCENDWLIKLYEHSESNSHYYADLCTFVASCPSSYEDAVFKEYLQRYAKNNKIWHCYNEKIGEHIFFTGKKRKTCPSPADLKPTRAEIDAWSKEAKEKIEKRAAEIAKEHEIFKKKKEDELNNIRKIKEEQEKERENKWEEFRKKKDKSKVAYFKKYGYTFVDARDGKKYRAVKIGEQEWMAENLNYETSYSSCSTDDKNCEEFGRYYAFPESEKAKDEVPCPSGWHLPSGDDFMQLFSYVLNDCKKDGFDSEKNPRFEEKKCVRDRLLFTDFDEKDCDYGCDFYAFSIKSYPNKNLVNNYYVQGNSDFWCQPTDDREQCAWDGISDGVSRYGINGYNTIRCIRDAGTTGLQTKGENSDNHSVENVSQQSPDICAKVVNEAKKIYEKCTSLQKGTPERSECVKLFNSRKQLAQKKCRIGGDN